ncbi:MAG: UDP-N-acetylglucosamine 2-epimerase (non-hydrolyzing) [Candidatus Thiothrix putei]|uniref:UDP-N-acetylglucosamine 2-epimerase (non-hydrolyzing) n=1 Tax=Candidatus Thiothrix putei TaxID=3080811 RepID=A0AA95KPZ3_9GAMM|nr:MAG: UDP-N-acetylglucosamine 2-epimerase (non-hydrolyzing) [Candidatus Thiothrix putei]
MQVAQKIPVGHVEAGLRTYNKWAPYPEECNRRMLSAVADYHFTPTSTATQALRKEGISEGIFQVGNTVIDSLLGIHNSIQQNLNQYNAQYAFLPSHPKSIILVTGHRRESFGEGFQAICQALLKIAKQHPEKYLLYPVHLNPNVRATVNALLAGYDNIKLIDPVPYDEMVYLMSRAWLIMTDSGGIQEEAPSLNKPVIVMRETTERPEGIASGCSVLGGISAESIYQNFCRINDSEIIYRQMAAALTPYGNGKSSLKIASILKNSLVTDKVKKNPPNNQQ